MHLTAGQEEVFWSQVDRSAGTSGCWLWTGASTGNRYPIFNVGGERLGAHRVAWCLHHGKALPDQDQIRRICRRRYCVNPAHLKRNQRKLSNVAKIYKKKRFSALSPPKGRRPKHATLRTLDSYITELIELKELYIAADRRVASSFEALRKQGLTITSVTKDGIQATNTMSRSLKQVAQTMQDLAQDVARTQESLLGQMRRLETKLDEVSQQQIMVTPPAIPAPPPEPKPEPPKPAARLSAAEPPPGRPSEGPGLSSSITASAAGAPGCRRPASGCSSLAKAFSEALDGHAAPMTEDEQVCLQEVMDLALSRAEKDTAEAVRQFVGWLRQFKKSAQGTTPQQFLQFVIMQR